MGQKNLADFLFGFRLGFPHYLAHFRHPLVAILNVSDSREQLAHALALAFTHLLEIGDLAVEQLQVLPHILTHQHAGQTTAAETAAEPTETAASTASTWWLARQSSRDANRYHTHNGHRRYQQLS